MTVLHRPRQGSHFVGRLLSLRPFVALLFSNALRSSIASDPANTPRSVAALSGFSALRRLTTLLSVSTLLGLSSASQASQQFGPALDPAKAVSVAQVLAEPAKYQGQQLVVKGKIDAVCQKQGCWMQFQTASSEPTFRIKVKDDDMVFPVSAKGKTAYASGKLSGKPLDLAQTRRYLQHRAEEQGETFDPATVTAPITLFQLAPESVLIE